MRPAAAAGVAAGRRAAACRRQQHQQPPRWTSSAEHAPVSLTGSSGDNGTEATLLQHRRLLQSSRRRPRPKTELNRINSYGRVSCWTARKHCCVPAGAEVHAMQDALHAHARAHACTQQSTRLLLHAAVCARGGGAGRHWPKGLRRDAARDSLACYSGCLEGNCCWPLKRRCARCARWRAHVRGRHGSAGCGTVCVCMPAADVAGWAAHSGVSKRRATQDNMRPLQHYMRGNTRS